MTRVSILSAVRDEETHLPEMIASVQGQDHEDWELLFVDDGSTDATVELIRRHAERDPRIKLVASGAAIGKTTAFNRAFGASTGEVIVLTAGDDRIPPSSLRVRAEVVDALPPHPSVAYFKLRTFSDEPRFDGMVLPRGPRGSRSGGALTMNRALAETLFPIDESLVSEDIWLGYGSEHVATTVEERSEIVLEYRIHPGNSNPRHLRYPDATRSLHARHRAWHLLAQSDLPLDEKSRAQLGALWRAELARHAGRTVAVLRTTELSLMQRLGLASLSDPLAYRLRNRFYAFFSGRQGR